MKKNILTIALLILVFTACKKEYLDKKPIDQLTDATAFITYDNFKTYTWGLYDYMSGYGNSANQYPGTFTSQEFNSDNFSQTLTGGQSAYATGSKTVPATAGGATSSQQVSGWNFSYLRRVNIMLDHIDGSEMSQTDKDHWRSVGYFFRALRYYDMIAAFGDVPWIDHALNINDTTALYAERTPRDVVAKKVLDELIWAESHIKTTGDGPNTINVHVVRALISRFGLFEGTWRKYHNLPDAHTYLQACVTYSQKLLPSFPAIMSSYDDVYNSEDLTGKAGIILFKQYIANATINNSSTNINPAIVRYTGSTNWYADVPKDVIESYLCTDGKPISTSTVYAGDDSMFAVFKNRDRRLYFTIIPPYRVKISLPQASPYVNFTADANPNYAEFINLMNALPGNTNKKLPLQAQSTSMQLGNTIPDIPHFSTYTNALSNMPTVVAVPQVVTRLGYYYWKYYNRLPQDNGTNNTADCALFRIEEVMLNYAEASFELGSFTQTIADQTINKLRARANVAAMNVAAINTGFDLKRDPTVDPVLWEIRRERRIELFGDGFRFNDLKRWAKGAYLNQYALGVKIKKADYGNKVTIDGTGTSGYVKFFSAVSGWNDKFYLEPIPTQEIVINPKLTQNPGW